MVLADEIIARSADMTYLQQLVSHTYSRTSLSRTRVSRTPRYLELFFVSLVSTPVISNVIDEVDEQTSETQLEHSLKVYYI